MEQVAALTERIKALKTIAASMHEGAFHTHLIPEIDKILALPDDLHGSSVGEREAVARQVREYEQTFDRLGYTLLEQLMPSVGVSTVFQIVQAAEQFKVSLRPWVGKEVERDGEKRRFTQHDFDVLTRTSLSIGTPPATAGMKSLIARMVFGREVRGLLDHVETLTADPNTMRDLLGVLGTLIEGSLHYCTASEEAGFLREASEFTNFEGGRILNRVVVTESPDRVVELIRDHVFDKFSPGTTPPVRVVEGVDGLNWDLVSRMQAEPNQVFLVKVTRIPYWLFQPPTGENVWRSVLGRLILIDASDRAHLANTTIVYTLFPHVARTLRNVQTGFAGRPANTQLALRRMLERFSPDTVRTIGRELDQRIAFLEAEGVAEATLEDIRVREWRRDGLLDYLTLRKLRRFVAFLEVVSDGTDEQRGAMAKELRTTVSRTWLRYFYGGLPVDRYHATVVPGGGRGALTIVGEHHRQRVREAVEAFANGPLAASQQRLEELKRDLSIPDASTDEIQAAMKQSALRSLSPTQKVTDGAGTRLAEHLPRAMLYRAVDAASKVTRRTQVGLERAAYGNVTGGAAAFLKKRMSKAGFGALHGRLEDMLGERVDRYDQGLRNYLVPVQELIRSVQKATDDLRGDLDPVAVGEIEAILKSIAQGSFYPTLILPTLSWSYGDVFPEKHYPSRWALRIELNRHHEMDPMALLGRLEELRYLLRKFPEVFALYCESMLLVINSPHNPTGVVYRRETILRLLQIAAEYGITVVDDNAYHKLVSSKHKAREGDACVAQIYEKHAQRFPRPLRLVTVGATTKGLQGSGDRTGILVTDDDGLLAFAEERASRPHLMSLYMTQLKLECGLAAKRWTSELERISAELVKVTQPEAADGWYRTLLEADLTRLTEPDFPIPLFEELLDGYEEMIRLQQRGGTVADLSRLASETVKRIKHLRPERALRTDVEQRIQRVREARKRVWPKAQEIAPDGAFYYCIRLCSASDDRGVLPFLRALSRHTKVDVTYAGGGFVRLSLGGAIEGDARSYDQLGRVVEVYLGLLERAWARFEEHGRDPASLPEVFASGGSLLDGVLRDLGPLLEVFPASAKPARGNPLVRDERGTVYCIEEGKSVTDKIFVTMEPCETVKELLESRTFSVVYRRLLRKVYRNHVALTELSFAQVDNQYGSHACRMAYQDRQLIDDLFRSLMREMYEVWHGGGTGKILAARLNAREHGEKVAALHGINRKTNELINDLMHAFEVPDDVVRKNATFDIGYEVLQGLHAAPAMPSYLGRIVERCDFAGATTALNPSPNVVTGAAKRVADHRYGFTRRDGDGTSAPGREHFRTRFLRFAELTDFRDYVCKAVQVGPYRMLLVLHKSCFHLLSDELRLFPQIEAVQTRAQLEGLRWDGVLLFGIPAKVAGDSYRSGYILDRGDDDQMLPVAWVAREDATDYVGFLKKSLLTIHNELVKSMGGMPVHGAMITITFKNGLRKTLAFSADSGTGKSETITAMMEQIIAGVGPAVELRRVDILASDMLSLWRGTDGQIYAFGTETGDFLRINDITEGWKAHFGDLMNRGAYSNIDHPKNARVTIPGICNVRDVLSPTRVNGFFYINNYEGPRGSAVELSEDPHQVLKHTLVRGLRKNKGTSGDQPSLRAGMEFSGKTSLVVRFRHSIDELLDWETREVDGAAVTCMVFRDGAPDVFAARDLVQLAFKGCAFKHDGIDDRIDDVEFDVLRNLFWVKGRSGKRLPLERAVFDQVYEPLTSTFCGNPFMEPEGMDRTLQLFAATMWDARVHTGVIRTQLARKGYEFSGPAKAAEDIVAFLLEDEEVNARFQRNKGKVHQAMTSTFGGVLEAGSNLPVELEGYNLLLLEKHESRHVAFLDAEDQPFTRSTPYYEFDPKQQATNGTFAPAIALPENVAVIRDICNNADFDFNARDLEIDLRQYDSICYWNGIEELTYQVLLMHGVIGLGSSDAEVARFPLEVRKAWLVAQRIAGEREPLIGASLPRGSVFPHGRRETDGGSYGVDPDAEESTGSATRELPAR